jgi:hypothetical protein
MAKEAKMEGGRTIMPLTTSKPQMDIPIPRIIATPRNHDTNVGGHILTLAHLALRKCIRGKP